MPTPQIPVAGNFVRAIVNTAGKAKAVFAVVQSAAVTVTSLVGSSGEPYLTLAYVTNPALLSTPNFHSAWTILSGVPHISASGVTADAVQAKWDVLLPNDASAAISASSATVADDSVAVAAEIQRKKALGTGHGPVVDSDVTQLSGTASAVAARGGS